MSTQSGLKKAHKQFDEISDRLDTTYAAAKRTGNIELQGGVVGIMAKMCADSILNKRLPEKGRYSTPQLGFGCF